MQNKGQVSIGNLIVLLVVVVLGVTLMIQVSQDIGNASSTMVYNSSITDQGAQVTIPASGVVVDLTGQELFNTPTVLFANGSEIDDANMYTIDEGVSTSTGVKTVRYVQNNANCTGCVLNVSYEYGDDGYIDSSAGRSIAGLIVIFFALAIAIIVLEPTLRSGILNKMGI